MRHLSISVPLALLAALVAPTWAAKPKPDATASPVPYVKKATFAETLLAPRIDMPNAKPIPQKRNFGRVY